MNSVIETLHKRVDEYRRNNRHADFPKELVVSKEEVQAIGEYILQTKNKFLIGALGEQTLIRMAVSGLIETGVFKFKGVTLKQCKKKLLTIIKNT